MLLKSGQERTTAQAALARFARTILPVYAIKEFQYGPLRAFRYFHNKLATTKSFSQTAKPLQQLSRTPQKNLLSTALEALSNASELFSSRIDSGLLQTHRPGMSSDALQADELRLASLQIMLLAWRKRRSIT